MARKKTRKTAKRKSASRRRGGGGPLKALSSKVSSLASRVSHLEDTTVKKKVKHHHKVFAGTADEVY